MIDIRSMLPDEIAALFAEMGEKAFRAKQVFAWLQRGVASFDEMTNIPAALRHRLAETCTLAVLTKATHQTSADGTEKFLWQLEDGECVESVLMRHKHGNTICISSQVGCRMGCAFCASTIGGLTRNLTASEMLGQVMFTQRESGAVISNIVLMGIGEPLDNFDNVMRFLTLVNHPDGLHIGMRHITISTCGIVQMIDKLAGYDLQLTLSISLHAPDDETRATLMPVGRTTSVRELLNASRRYARKTGRRVSFEYALIRGVNDQPHQAKQLAEQMKEFGGHVNVIPLNPVIERAYRTSDETAEQQFVSILKQAGANVTIRRRLGADIDAACGQLRQRREGHA